MLYAAAKPVLDSGSTAWMLAASALVLLMTPGLAFFYGGLTRSKSTLNMMQMSFLCIGLVSIMWVLYGYTMAFGDDTGAGLIGNLTQWLGMSKMTTDTLSGTIPTFVFAAFQLMFAIITPALISGSIADRAKFGGWVLFVFLWTSIVYFPVAHWVFDIQNGWIGGANGFLAHFTGHAANDFAGGTAVHINAGAAALACCLVLGKRRGWPGTAMRPHNVPFVLLGAGLLWFGWFGFNAGSEVAADGIAGIAFINTQVATAAALIGWIGVEKLRDGHATTIGSASGAVAGLVAITPACNALSPFGAVILGLIAGGACCFAVGLKYKLGFDDSLDVVGVHLVGGIIGTLLIGFLSTSDGLFYGGNGSQLAAQAIAALAVFTYSFVLAYILAIVVDKTIGFRIPEEDEETGIDITTHSESAYDFVGTGSGSLIAMKEGI